MKTCLRARWGPAGMVVPENIISKPPTAELKPDQKDEDTLPPYEVLDAILTGLNERDLSIDDVVAEGHDRALVLRIWRMLLGGGIQTSPGTARCKDYGPFLWPGPPLSYRQCVPRTGINVLPAG